MAELRACMAMRFVQYVPTGASSWPKTVVQPCARWSEASSPYTSARTQVGLPFSGTGA